jgi:hypothetical protein
MRCRLAGQVALLVLGLAASGPVQVAASDGLALPVVSVVATLERVAARAVDGSIEVARDLRSIYSLYQLQTAPDRDAPVVLAPATDTVPQLLLCDLYQAGKHTDTKKKTRT